MKKKRIWKMMVAILIVSLFGSNVAMAQEMTALPEGTIVTEYGERNVRRTDVGDDVYTLITDVYRVNDEEQYTVYTLITRDETITYNTDTGIMDYGDKEIVVRVREYQEDIHVANTRSTYAGRPTSLDHGHNFKKNWVYIQSFWTDIYTEGDLEDLTKGALYILLNYAVPGLGDAVDYLDQLVEYFSVERPMDSSFWIRRYQYANQHILSQFQILATQGYTYNYEQIPGAVSVVSSELA